MKISLKDKGLFRISKDKLFVLFFFENKPIFLNLIPQEDLRKIKEGDFESFIFKKARFIFFNLGKEEEFSLRKLRSNVRKITRFLESKEAESSEWLVDPLFFRKDQREKILEEIVENIILAGYNFETFKTKKQKALKRLNLYLEKPKQFGKGLRESQIIAESVNFVRELANAPASEMTPKKLAGVIRKEFRRNRNVSVEIFDKEKIKKRKMGGLLGVSKGSKEEPRFIIIKYFGKKGSKKTDLVFVGKGVTFDSGGLNLKAAEGMADMYMDKSGAGAVVGALRAIALLKLPFNIIGLIPAVENMPSSGSYKPGDVLTAYNGKTVEVLNTDAEGRIILADALSYGIKNFKPRLIVDVATLTGAALVALGQRAIALFTNREELEARLKELGEESGDYLWPMPLWEEYQEEIKGTFGDIQNIGKTKYGGAITAAIFLRSFVDNTPWIHLDIAPTMTSINSDNLAKGATGSGTRFLIELVKNFKKLWN